MVTISYWPVISYIDFTPLTFFKSFETCDVGTDDEIDTKIIADAPPSSISIVNFFILPVSTNLLTLLLTAASERFTEFPISPKALLEFYFNNFIISSSITSIFFVTL